MSESPQFPRSRSHFGRWIAVLLFLVVAANAARLAYIVLRQREIISRLEERGFNVFRMSLFAESRPEWIGIDWLPEFYGFIYVDDGDGNCGDDDLRAIRELYSFTYDGFYELAKNAFVVVQTTDTTLYSNVIIYKGVIWSMN